jgi:hypothetical protein
MITLVCAACGKRKEVDCTPPQLGIDFAEICKSTGFLPVMDFAQSRVVVFCSDECKKANLKKNGTLRRYIRKPQGKVSETNDTVTTDRGTQSAPVAPAGVVRRGGAPSARPEKGKEE